MGKTTVLERKNWKYAKFGQSKNDGPGPNEATTMIDPTDVRVHFLLDSSFKSIDPFTGQEVGKVGPLLYSSSVYQLINLCHFRRRCMSRGDEIGRWRKTARRQKRSSDPLDEPMVSQSLRCYREVKLMVHSFSAMPIEEEVTIRVTNIMEDTDGREDSLDMQEELRELFQSMRDEYYKHRAARIARERKEAEDEAFQEGLPKPVHAPDTLEPRPVRVKLPLHDRGPKEGKPRGFAFITCQCKEEADYVIGRLDNKARHRMMVLRVEVAR